VRYPVLILKNQRGIKVTETEINPPMAETSVVHSASRTITAPVVIDLGKTKQKKIKDLKRGGGRLMDEIFETTQRVRATLGEGAEGKEFIPIVLIYKKKSRRRNPFGF
jgi:hypothetical protein